MLDFNNSPHQVPGRTGNGVDTTKKLSQHTEFQSALSISLRFK
jgi:hypothetical protein